MIEQRLAATLEQALAQAGAVSGGVGGSVCHGTDARQERSVMQRSFVPRAERSAPQAVKGRYGDERDEIVAEGPVRGRTPVLVGLAPDPMAPAWLPRPRAGRRRRGVGGAQADRQQRRRQRTRQARRPGILRPRPHRAAHPAGQQPRHRRSRQSRPHRARRAGRDARSSGTARSKSIASPRAGCGSRAGWSATRSAGARSTNCCPRRPASRSPCPTSSSMSPTRRSRCARRTARSASRCAGAAICRAGSRASSPPRRRG